MLCLTTNLRADILEYTFVKQFLPLNLKRNTPSGVQGSMCYREKKNSDMQIHDVPFKNKNKKQ